MSVEAPELSEERRVRYASRERFLRDFDANLGRGLLFVRSQRAEERGAVFRVAVEVPSTETVVEAEVRVIASFSGTLGLELLDFGGALRETLERAFEALEATLAPPPPEPPPEPPVEAQTVAPALEEPPAPELPIAPSAEAGALAARPSISALLGGFLSMPPPAAAPVSPPPRPDPPPVASEPAVPEAALPEPPGLAAEPPLVAAEAGPATPELPPAAPASPRPGSMASRIDAMLAAELEPASETSALEDRPAPEGGASPSVEPAPLPPEAPAASVEVAPAASIPAEHPGLRATAGGVVRVGDVADLLGVYLSSLRHGALMLHGGPSGEVGEAVPVKIVRGRVVTLEAVVRARIGDWVFLSVADVEELVTLLDDLAPEWREALDRLWSRPATAATARPSIPVLAAPSVAPPPPTVSLPPPPIEPPPTPTATALVFDEPGPPQQGRLEGDKIVFRGPKDLAHELKSNIKNGGLMARSEPLPIRAHKSLLVMLGAHELGLRIEAHVVYAANGTVGFSLTGHGELAASIERVIAKGFMAPPPTGAPRPITVPPGAPQAAGPSLASAAPAPAPVVPAPPAAAELTGELLRPFTHAELLMLPANRRRAALGAEERALVLLDHLGRKKTTGLLHMTHPAGSMAIYLHEGTIAFVKAEPWNESLALGRLLVQRKKISGGQLADALSRARAERRQLGKLLVHMRLIDQVALVTALREQTRRTVEQAFEWPAGGTFELRPWAHPPVTADLALTSVQGVEYHYLRRGFEALGAPELERLLTPHHARVPRLTGDPSVEARHFALEVKERRFFQTAIDGRNDLAAAIGAGASLGKLVAMRLLALGLAVDLITFLPPPP